MRRLATIQSIVGVALAGPFGVALAEDPAEYSMPEERSPGPEAGEIPGPGLDLEGYEQMVVDAVDEEMPGSLDEGAEGTLRLRLDLTQSGIRVVFSDEAGTVLLERVVPLDEGLVPAVRTIVLLARRAASMKDEPDLQREAWGVRGGAGGVGEAQGSEAPRASDGPPDLIERPALEETARPPTGDREPSEHLAPGLEEPAPADAGVGPEEEAPTARAPAEVSTPDVDRELAPVRTEAEHLIEVGMAMSALGWRRPLSARLGPVLTVEAAVPRGGRVRAGGRLAFSGVAGRDISTSAIDASAAETMALVEARLEVARVGRLGVSCVAGAGVGRTIIWAAPSVFAGDVVPFRIGLLQGLGLAAAALDLDVAPGFGLRLEAGALGRAGTHRVRLPPGWEDEDDPLETGWAVPWGLVGLRGSFL